jgi:methyl-CpG-binding domain protein 4
VDQVRDAFFEKYPDADSASCAISEEMSEIISILGFKNKRAHTIIKFSSDWINSKWSEPIELYGIGKYGQDSWEIFQKGNLNVSPTDGVLTTYLDWIKTSTLKTI